MPLATPTAIAIFFTIWWIVLFAVLPFGVKTQNEDKDGRFLGTDPGAPVAPHMMRKAAITTFISILVFIALMIYISYANQA